MFSIGEFARLGGVSVRTLRHYDEIGLLRPATVDQDTGYRGYTADQLGQLNQIMALKELGLSQVPAMGVVVIAGQAPAFGPANIVPVVNHLVGEFERLEVGDRVKEAGPRMLLYDAHGEGVTVYLAQPVTEPPGELAAPARYRALPEIEAAVAVRSGPAASIFPVVYHELVRWIDERGYRAVTGSNREVWVNEVDDIADVAQQVFEIQLPFARPGTPAAD
jgi:hypothetical protein